MILMILVLTMEEGDDSVTKTDACKSYISDVVL